MLTPPTGGSDGKASACHVGELGSIPGSERPPGEGSGNHSSTLAWEIPWTEEPGGLQRSQTQRSGFTSSQPLLSSLPPGGLCDEDVVGFHAHS